VAVEAGGRFDERLTVDIGTANHSPAWLTVRGFKDAAAKLFESMLPVHSLVEDSCSNHALDPFLAHIDLRVPARAEDHSSSDDHADTTPRGSQLATLGQTNFDRTSIQSRPMGTSVKGPLAVLRDSVHTTAKHPPTAAEAVTAHLAAQEQALQRPLPKTRRTQRSMKRGSTRGITLRQLQEGSDLTVQALASEVLPALLDPSPHRALGFHPIPCFVVEGPPYSGKTVLGHWVAVTLIHSQCELIPFYVPVLDLVAFLRAEVGATASIVSYLVHQYSELGFRRALVQQAMCSRRAVFIFDGLQDAGQELGLVEDMIWSLALQFHRVLVLTRPGRYTQARFKKWPWNILEVPPLSVASSLRWAQLRLGFFRASPFMAWVESEFGNLEKSPAIFQLLLDAYDEAEGPPQNFKLTELFEEGVKRLLQRVARTLEMRRIAVKVRMMRTLIILETVAVVCHLRETDHFTDADVKACRTLDTGQHEGWATISLLAQTGRAALIAGVPASRSHPAGFCFVHPMFHHFLVSRVIARRLLHPDREDPATLMLPTVEQLFRIASRPWWSGTVAFLAVTKELENFPSIASYLHQSRCPPLVVAAEHGFLELIQVMLRCKANPEARGPDGTTALLRAVMSCHVTTVQFLLDQKAEIKAIDKIGASAMHVAAMCGHCDIVHLLYRAKADLSLRDVAGNSPSDIAEKHGYVDVVEYISNLLLQADQVSRRLQFGSTNTMDFDITPTPRNAANSPPKTRRVDSMKERFAMMPSHSSLLIPVEEDVVVQEEEEEGWGEMQKQFDHEENRMRETFLQFDTNGDGYISLLELHKGLLHMGVQITAVELEKMMADADKDSDDRIDFDEFWMVWQTGRETVKFDLNKVHSAIRWGKHLGVIQAMCTQRSVINSPDPKNGNQCLHISVQNGHIDHTEWLLAMKGEVNGQNRSGNTPLHMATGYDFLHLTRMLLAARANPDVWNMDDCRAITGLKGDKVGKEAWDAPLNILRNALADDDQEAIEAALDQIKKQPHNVDKDKVVVEVMRNKKTLKSWTTEVNDKFVKMVRHL